MEPITLKPERQAELADYAKRHGTDPETALDQILADYFAREDREKTVEGVDMVISSGGFDRA